MKQWATGGKARGIGSLREQEQRAPSRRTTRNEVSLGSMVLEHQPEEVPAQAEVDGQLRSNFPVVVDIAAVVVLAVVRQGDIRDEYRVALTCAPGPPT